MIEEINEKTIITFLIPHINQRMKDIKEDSIIQYNLPQKIVLFSSVTKFQKS